PLIAGLLLVLVASIVIARRPSVGFVLAGAKPERRRPGPASYESSDAGDADQLLPSRRIAVAPAYNEAPTVTAVLEELYTLVDEVIVVDDGSTDDTREIIERWLPGHDQARMLTLDVNCGMSAAYHLAFSDLRARVSAG